MLTGTHVERFSSAKLQEQCSLLPGRSEIIVGNIMSVMPSAGRDKQLLLNSLQFYSAKAKMWFPES